jgi:acyl carrier protein
MDRPEITARMKELLAKQKHLKTDLDAITDTVKLDAVGFDSITIMDFMYDVEDEFGIETEIADLVKLETVGDMLDYLQSKISN